MKYTVNRYWSMTDTVVVEAESVTDAIGRAHAVPVDNAHAEFVPDSMNTDPDNEVKPAQEPEKGD